MADGKALKAQYDRRLTARANHEPDWRMLGRYVFPRKSLGIGEMVTPGTKKTQYLFDSSATHDAELLGASLAGALMPPSLHWFLLIARDRRLRQLKSVRDWLEEVRDIALLTLSQSNFAAEIMEALLDLVVFGTACLLEEEAAAGYAGTFGGVRFKAEPIARFVIDEDPFGRVDTIQRQFEMSAQNIAATFPGVPLGAKIPEALTNKPESLFWVLHSRYPRRDGSPLRRTRRNMPWADCYSLLDEPEVILREGGQPRFGFMVPRWAKATGEQYGYGPAHTALPDIRTLNREIELYLAAAGKAIDPTLLVDDDGVVSTSAGGPGQLTLEPAGVIYRRAGAVIEPLESTQRFDVAHMLHERLETKISEVFYLDALRLRFKPNMTATEVIALQEEMLRLLGPTGGRLYPELLSLIVENTIGILADANQLPPPPAEFEDGGADIDIQYQGPLARAQHSADLQAIERVQMLREKVATVMQDTAVFDNYDLDGEQRHYALTSGYPADLVKDASQVAEVRAARDKATLEAKQKDEMAMMAESAGKVAPLVKAMKPQGAAA